MEFNSNLTTDVDQIGEGRIVCVTRAKASEFVMGSQMGLADSAKFAVVISDEASLKY